MIASVRRVSELLLYSPDSGEFRWRVDHNNVKAGSIAGSLNGQGYLQVQIDGRKYPAHRVAWALARGEWPAAQIDHINGVRSDNRLANLREASNAQNSQNRRAHRNNTSGFTGVSFHRATGKWQALIICNRKRHYLGLHDSAPAAAAVYADAKQRLHSFNPVVRRAHGA